MLPPFCAAAMNPRGARREPFGLPGRHAFALRNSAQGGPSHLGRVGIEIALKCAHIAGLSVWVAGLIAMPGLLAGLDSAEGEKAGRLRFSRFAFELVFSPAAVLAIASGIALIFVSSYQIGWLAPKLLLIGVLSLLHLLIGRGLARVGRRFMPGRAVRALMVLGAIAGTSAVLALALGKPVVDEALLPQWVTQPLSHGASSSALRMPTRCSKTSLPPCQPANATSTSCSPESAIPQGSTAASPSARRCAQLKPSTDSRLMAMTAWLQAAGLRLAPGTSSTSPRPESAARQPIRKAPPAPQSAMRAKNGSAVHQYAASQLATQKAPAIGNATSMA